MAEVWTIKAALDWCRGYLERKGDENPRLSAEWLLAEATGLRRVELYVNFDRPLTSEERDTLRDYVARRGAGEPLQYITGEVAFRHIAVKVRPGVLIPRPETEVLVSEALSLLPAPGRRHAIDSNLTEDEAQALLLKEAAHKAATEGLGDGASAVMGESVDAEHADDADVSAAANDAVPDSTSLYVADICTGSG
ncbi:class I SAM-dependent methyltransferase, partial [uncultured Slackia sp.]|uniref:N5-glutamine methyltransferase family protein n=1 Tax=uncultured Slackia sp. TaxID=665903 RepID=UPI00345BF9B6